MLTKKLSVIGWPSYKIVDNQRYVDRKQASSKLGFGARYGVTKCYILAVFIVVNLIICIIDDMRRACVHVRSVSQCNSRTGSI